jgi:urate oxidase
MTSAASALLGANYHGKDRVRVAKVRRGTDGVHQFAEFLARIELRGGTEASYTHGDNRMVVATDTCKNHVYMLAKTHDCATPEQFGLDLALTFLKNYSHVKVAAITITETPWKRVILDGSAHKHGFVKHAEGSRVARAVATRVPGRQVPDVQVTTTLRGFVSKFEEN